MNKEIMRKTGFGKVVEMVEAGVCPFCQNPVKLADFRDDLSIKEYKISGLCQKCQDGFFEKE